MSQLKINVSTTTGLSTFSVFLEPASSTYIHKTRLKAAAPSVNKLLKMSFLTQERTFSRKLKELYLAVLLERNYSKDAILAAYLNTAYFGADAYGISKACRIYYGISPESLTLAQSAMLAGLVQAPTYYNPFENYEAAKSRQKIVLDRMADQELITKAQADKAYAEACTYKKKGKT